MLPQTGSTQRRAASTRLSQRPSTTPSGRRKLSKLDRERLKASNGSWTTGILVAGFIVLILLSVFVLVYSLANSNNINPTDPQSQAFDAQAIDKMVKTEKQAQTQAINSHNAVSYTVENPNAVKVTFRLYATPNCDESDESQYITITRESTDVSADSAGDSNTCPLCYEFCGKKFNDQAAQSLNERNQVKGIKIISNDISAQLDLYSDCGLHQYHSTIYEFEGCVHIYDWPNTAGIKIRRNYLDFPQKLPPPIEQSKLPPMQEHLVVDGISDESKQLSQRQDIPSYLIVYSCESSEYCAFQAQANYYGYLTSAQHPTKSGFLRLLTAQEPDDMASYVPTFTAPRNLYSRRYSPYNKADVMVKWYESKPNRPDALGFDIVVVIDPDNWIIRDITHWIVQVSEGHAMGEAAWFHGNPLVENLWKEVCRQNCDAELDMVGVPYIVHRNDLEKIAPYFKLYIDIMKEREERDTEFLNRYKGIQMGWGTEMFGYIFGAAHAGIRHKVVHGIQRRDVSARPQNKQEELGIDMIHMGRAWWPHDYPLSKKYAHTEGKAWSRFGQQVWCKCNFTASDIIPWPMPPREQVDFQSYHTLYLLYHGREYFGALPSSKYRKPLRRYHEPYP